MQIIKFAKKSLGQNFLIDNNIIKKIVNLSKIKDQDILEIGAGKGALSDEIIKKNPKSLFLIEKDTNLANQLRIKYKTFKQVKVFNADILKYKLEKTNLKNITIFGNLPYNISSQILIKILKSPYLNNFENLIFMFQKELGEKILGKYKTINYGRLSIISNYKLNLMDKFLISKNCFYPKPKVTSMVIHFKPKKKTSNKIRDLNNLEKITKILFSKKRKMINKAIFKILSRQQVKKIDGLKLTLRPAEIEPNIYYKITELYENKN